ncbi:MAG: hypothetical protein NW201_05490 [Gemmatimonadales bacterium]|nr:hypothetical protein [Gemmatimonadales bacterium]
MLLLSRGSVFERRRWERRLATEGPDALFDQPELAERLRQVRTILVPSEPLYFYVTLRAALRRAGLDSRELADYLAALLVEFGRRDRAFRIDWHDDQQHRYVIDILADLESTGGARRFKVLVHLGNYTLWLSGVFRAWIEARRLRRGGPDVSYYERMGQRGFALASEDPHADVFGLADVLGLAAARFPAVRSALNGVAEETWWRRSA